MAWHIVGDAAQQTGGIIAMLACLVVGVVHDKRRSRWVGTWRYLPVRTHVGTPSHPGNAQAPSSRRYSVTDSRCNASLQVSLSVKQV